MHLLAGGGAPAVDETNHLAALRAFNATSEQLEQARAALERRKRTAVFEVWPENWRAFELFQAMGSSWEIAVLPSGAVRLLGLKWHVLDSIERRLTVDPDDEDVPDSRTLFYQLRGMEGEFMDLRNSRS